MLVGITQNLFSFHNLYYTDSVSFHYLHFLLHILEHYTDLRDVLYTDLQLTFFSNFTNMDSKYWYYFIELAHFNFPKEKFLKFLGKLLAFYTKSAVVPLVAELLFYIKKQFKLEALSKENIMYILKYMRSLQNSIYQIKRHSKIPIKRKKQIEAIRIIYDFQKEIFSENDEIFQHDKNYACPSQSLKRSICSSSEINPEKIRELQYQAFRVHLRKIEQISSYLNTGFLTKTILSDLLQGHWSEVAINFGFIMGSLMTNEAANELFKQGSLLAEEIPSLTEDSNLIKVSNLFEKEWFANKKLFLGKTMQVVSPFIRRAASIFFIYQLKEQIQTYRNGDKTVLPNMMTNGMIVGIDGLEAGIGSAEFLNLINSLSEWTGPGGNILAALALLSVEVYNSVQQVKMLEQYVDLSFKEEIIEFSRAFFHMPPSEYLEDEIKNEQLVKNAILFLKKYRQFDKFFFPSFQSTSVSKHVQVFLNETLSSLSDSDNLPDEDRLFCVPGKAGKPTLKPMRYRCQNAFGIEYPLNRTAHASLFDLGVGDDQVVAFPDSWSFFIVKSGNKLYQGSDVGNAFILEGNLIRGRLLGGKGTNALTLDNFYPESDYLLNDINDYLCGKTYINSDPRLPYIFDVCPEGSLKLDNITRIYGRRNQQDIVFITKKHNFIDGYGGKNKEYPDRFFLTENSYQNPTIVLRNNTCIVVYRNSTLCVDYSIPIGEVGVAQIQSDIKKVIQHRFFFELPLQNIVKMTTENSTVLISVADSAKHTFFLNISNPYSDYSNTTNFPTNILYFFQDFELIMLNKNELQAKEILVNNITTFEKVTLFEKLANRLDKNIVAQLINNATIFIGSRKNEILYTTGLTECHLIMSGGENLCVILTDKNTEFPLFNVTLYKVS